jgi:hypothetical protein
MYFQEKIFKKFGNRFISWGQGGHHWIKFVSKISLDPSLIKNMSNMPIAAFLNAHIWGRILKICVPSVTFSMFVFE